MNYEEALALSETYTYIVNEVLEIDPEARTITVPSGEIVMGVYHDRNVERKYFTCPRIVGDNVDLSEGYIFVNYESVGGVVGAYQCDDVEVDGDNITFSWLLSDNVFDSNVDGTVSFAVQAKNADYETVFGTQIASGTAYKTIEASEEIVSEYADVIMQILLKLSTVESGATSYNDLNDLPTIEGVTVAGDLLLTDFGLDVLTDDEITEAFEAAI